MCSKCAQNACELRVSTLGFQNACALFFKMRVPFFQTNPCSTSTFLFHRPLKWELSGASVFDSKLPTDFPGFSVNLT